MRRAKYQLPLFEYKERIFSTPRSCGVATNMVDGWWFLNLAASQLVYPTQNEYKCGTVPFTFK